MLSDSDRRDVLHEVISEVVPTGVGVEWLASEDWSAHARLQGVTGLVGYLLTSPEWQEARFVEPHRSAFILTDGADRDDVQEALRRLARAVVAYICRDYRVERKRGLFGVRTTLVIETTDGPWRVGKSTVHPPRFND